jgi:hypothetical protein
MATTATCARCARDLGEGHGFVLAGERRCMRCTLMRSALLKRSLLTALVVGTILTAINQGGRILGGSLASDLAWRVPLTYMLPFCVATWGALVNSRPLKP